MKVLIVVDKIPSAIWVCAKAMERMKDWFGFDIVAVHPKRPSVEQLENFRKLAFEADLIDFQYWKTAEMLFGSFKFLKDKPKILTHHNPYDVDRENWFEKYDAVVVKNMTQFRKIREVFGKEPVLIPHTIDLNFFKFQREYPEDFKVLMVAARIEDKKGILEVAKACRATKTRFILVGRISDMDYMRQVMSEAGNLIDFRQDISDEELRKAYYESALLINNSSDGFESGTLPHLEAMACGVPVLTRNVGLVPDIANGKNMVVRPGTKDNWREIANFIEVLKKDRDQRLRLREEGFKTVLSRDNEYTARRYYRLYRKVLYKHPLVSVIIPTYNRKDVLGAVIASVIAQTYPNIEIIVVDDGSDDGTDKLVKQIKKSTSAVIKYIKQEKMGYGLARARNNGVVEANGNILVFLDDRLMMDVNAVDNFVKSLKPGVWLFGNKGVDKRSFVENFSCVYKKDLVKIGMFNERIIYYGGMTRDIVNRIKLSGIMPVYCPEAYAKPLVSSKSRFSKKDDIIKAKLLLWKLWGGE